MMDPFSLFFVLISWRIFVLLCILPCPYVALLLVSNWSEQLLLCELWVAFPLKVENYIWQVYVCPNRNRHKSKS